MPKAYIELKNNFIFMKKSAKNRKVVIIQRSIKFYRIKFFELLKDICNRNGIDLVLIYGEDDQLNFNDVVIDWGIKIKNYSLCIFGKKMYYQPIWRYIKNADLIIVEQATKYIVNHILWFLNLFRLKKLAFWGHGINFQRDNTLISKISEFFKKQYTKRVYWFFFFFFLSKKYIKETGLPENRITLINNTIDTQDIINEIQKYDGVKLKEIKKELNIKSDNVCIYVGGMYKEKRLDFLIKALQIIKEKVPDFEMILIGDGPDKDIVVDFENNNRWVHYLGKKNEKEKVPYLLISKLLLMPGLVGLVIVDSFIFGLPLITTDCTLHSPEICYLDNGINGIITKDDLNDFTNAVIDLLNDNEKITHLKENCFSSSKRYTIEDMTNNFFIGISEAIELYRS